MNYARFLDIKKGNFFRDKKAKLKSILVTNTKFTSKSIRYSKCVGVELLGWRYPIKKGLESLIEEKGLYPLTILPSFRKSMTNIFAQNRMMFVEDILRINPDRFSQKTKIERRKLEYLMKEARILLE